MGLNDPKIGLNVAYAKNTTSVQNVGETAGLPLSGKASGSSLHAPHLCALCVEYG